MSNLIFLTTKDFFLEQSQKGSSLCHRTPGVSLVFYYADACEGCQTIKPQYHQLPRVIGGCKFALVDLTKNPNLAQASKQTLAPIKYVPLLILYYDGRPFLQYDDDNSIEKIVEFVKYAMKILATKKPFSPEKGSGVKEVDIPAYSLGIPYNLVCDANRCYLQFNKAYPGKNK